MKILSCHIENFGKLHEVDLDLKEGLNVFREDNGWGKSTLAGFICAMFYGLEGSNKRKNIRENERALYAPWQGGPFGGTLTFSVENKTYVINRLFGEKENADEFELRDNDTNVISTDYTANIGEELFKINRASFLRSIFIGQNACDTGATDDINAKIGNLTDDTGDMNNFDKAVGVLEALENKLTPTRKTGSLKARNGEIQEYKEKVKNGENLNDSLSEIEKLHEKSCKERDEKVNELKETQALAEKVNRLQKTLARKENWEKQKNELNTAKEEYDTARAFFPGDVPKEEEIDNAIETYDRYVSVSEKGSAYALSEEEENIYSRISEKFINGAPDEAEIEAMLKKTGELKEKLRNKDSLKLSDSDMSRYEKLTEIYEEDESDTDEKIGDWQKRNTIAEDLKSMNQTLENEQNKTGNTSNTPIMPVVGACVMIVGIVISILKIHFLGGLVVAALGLVFFFIGLSGYLKKNTYLKERRAKEEELKGKIEAKERELAGVEGDIRTYLTDHGKDYDKYMVLPHLLDIKKEKEEYKFLQEKYLAFEKAVDEKEIEKERDELSHYLSRYGIFTEKVEENEHLLTLRNNRETYVRLKKKKDNLSESDNEMKSLIGETKAFLEKYGFKTELLDKDFLRRIRDSYMELGTKKSALKKAEADLEEFEKDLDVTALADDDKTANLPDIEELNEKIGTLNEKIDEIKEVIRDYESQMNERRDFIDEWESDKEHLEALNEIQAKERHIFDTAVLAKKYMTTAKEKLVTRYTRPILDSFKKYYSKITGEATDVFHIDATSKITYDELGKQRETETMSAAYRDLMGICLRMAFVDAMYTDEKPVIIMDDPFVNLDDDKVEASKKFLDSVAMDYQIIYLTCSRVRA